MKKGSKHVMCPICESSFEGTIPPHTSRLRRNDFRLQPCVEADQAIPTLADVRDVENPTPLVAEPPPFTLTAEVSTAADAHQMQMFAAPQTPEDMQRRQAAAADTARYREETATPRGWQRIEADGPEDDEPQPDGYHFGDPIDFHD